MAGLRRPGLKMAASSVRPASRACTRAGALPRLLRPPLQRGYTRRGRLSARSVSPRCTPRATGGHIDLAAPAGGHVGHWLAEPTGAQNMFFLTYLRRELRRRMRQAIFIALGLALGIGLV